MSLLSEVAGQTGPAWPSLLIFDCDGVLVDSEGIAARVEAACLTEAGLSITAEEIAREFTGIASATCHRVLESRFQTTLPRDFGAVVQARTLEAFDAELCAIPFVPQVLAALPGVVSCVASSSAPDRIARSLQLAGLSEWFGLRVFSASEVVRGKPAPDLFLYAAARMGVAPHRCAVVEDSIAGVQAAVSAGIPAIGFTGASHCGPDHADALHAAGAVVVMTDMRALPAVLASLCRQSTDDVIVPSAV